MKIRNILVQTAMLFALSTGTAVAEPKNGFSLNAGLASHNRDCNGCTGSSTSGLSLGMDYQFALSDKFSISPFLMTSSESSSNVSGTTVGHGILGAQLRYWAGDMFFGGHLGSYSEVLSNGGTSVSGSGGGAGLVAGWEMPDGGWYVMGQVDSAKVTYTTLSNTDIKFSAFRLSVGYRWK
jgi:Outer membrane protein beta-barrel domain